MMKTINCFTNGFHGQPSSVSGKRSKEINWVYGLNEFDGPTVFEDGHIWQMDVESIRTGQRIGWLHEGRELRAENYEAALRRRHLFDFILTHDRELLKIDPDKFRFTIRGGVTIQKQDWGLGKKSAAIAMLYSHKKQTEAHLLRHEIAETLDNIDLLGSGRTGIHADKNCLQPYRFAVVVDNTEPNLFTEHLLDVIALGCIPILYQTESMMLSSHPLDEFLDTSEIMLFRSISELRFIVDYVSLRSEDVYNHLQRGRNLKKLEALEVTEDWWIKRYAEEIG